MLLLFRVKMEEIVASVADLKFDIELQLYNQVGVQPLPFPGMDSTIHLYVMSIDYLFIVNFNVLCS